MRTADEKRSLLNGISHIKKGDMRGKHEIRPFKLPDAVIKAVKDHIDKFSVMDSHYCRAETKKKYFEEGLSVRKMHKMYQSDVALNDPNLQVSEQAYRKILNLHGSYGFFVPKKDR